MGDGKKSSADHVGGYLRWDRRISTVSRKDADAVEAVAWGEGVEFAGGGGEGDYISGDGIPIGWVEVWVELQAIGDV